MGKSKQHIQLRKTFKVLLENGADFSCPLGTFTHSPIHNLQLSKIVPCDNIYITRMNILIMCLQIMTNRMATAATNTATVQGLYRDVHQHALKYH